MLHKASHFLLPSLEPLYLALQNVAPKEFYSNFCSNYRELLSKILHTSYPFNESKICKVHCIRTGMTNKCEQFFQLQQTDAPLLLVFLFKQQPWLSGSGDGLTSSEPGFNSHWYPYESLMAAGRASGQNCSRDQ